MPSQAGSDCCREIALAMREALRKLVSIARLLSSLSALFCLAGASSRDRMCSQAARKCSMDDCESCCKTLSSINRNELIE
ncbi:hypothetical protein D3C84_694900 [compost metagenome]